MSLKQAKWILFPSNSKATTQPLVILTIGLVVHEKHNNIFHTFKYNNRYAPMRDKREIFFFLACGTFNDQFNGLILTIFL